MDYDAGVAVTNAACTALFALQNDNLSRTKVECTAFLYLADADAETQSTIRIFAIPSNNAVSVDTALQEAQAALTAWIRSAAEVERLNSLRLEEGISLAANFDV